MRTLVGLALIAATPVAAQTTPTPAQLATQGFARQQQAAGELNRHDGRAFADRASSSDVPVAAILQAGAWGRCVVAVAPALSRSYVETNAADPALKPVFSTCLRRTGAFLGSNRGDVRRAALGDALSSRR